MSRTPGDATRNGAPFPEDCQTHREAPDPKHDLLGNQVTSCGARQHRKNNVRGKVRTKHCSGMAQYQVQHGSGMAQYRVQHWDGTVLGPALGTAEDSFHPQSTKRK